MHDGQHIFTFSLLVIRLVISHKAQLCFISFNHIWIILLVTFSWMEAANCVSLLMTVYDVLIVSMHMNNTNYVCVGISREKIVQLYYCLYCANWQ